MSGFSVKGTRWSDTFAAQVPGGNKLLTKADFTYAGTCRINDYADALTWDPNTGRFFQVQKDVGIQEITLPTMVQTSNYGSLNSAVINNTGDGISASQEAAINGDNNTTNNEVHGLFVDGTDLIVTARRWYDDSGVQRKSIYRRAKTNLATTSAVQGPYRMLDSADTPLARLAGGQMARIPTAWRASLGNNDTLVHSTGLSIYSAGPVSMGPNLIAFKKADVGVLSPVPGVHLLYYPYSFAQSFSLSPQMGYPQGDLVSDGPFPPAPVWGNCGETGGMMWADGTRTIAFFGESGDGTQFYGDAFGTHGQHAEPYTYKYWLYDANDLIAVYNGTKNNYNVLPYEWGTWTFNINGSGNERHRLNGVAFDYTTNKVYLQRREVNVTTGVWDGFIDVYNVNVS